IELVVPGSLRPGPVAEGIRSLGRLDESALADVIAGAACLVQLSTRESLSLVSLAAWNHGVPVLAHRGCGVLREFIETTGGGQAVANYAEFRSALDDLLHRPDAWAKRGRCGQQAVRARFGSRDSFARQLGEVLRGLNRPLAEVMREKGRQVVAQRGSDAWSHELLKVIHHVMQSPRRSVPSHRVAWQIALPPQGLGSQPSLRVGVINRGDAPLWPGSCRIIVESGGSGESAWSGESAESVAFAGASDLDRVVPPGRSAWVRIPWPRGESIPPDVTVRVEVEGRTVASDRHDVVPRSEHVLPRSLLLMDEISQRLERAESLSQLPTGYVDVSEGWFAGLKRWIKRKVLGQFQTAYVDVLARQQSAYNRALVETMRDLAEQLAEVKEQLDVLARQAEPPRREQGGAANRSGESDLALAEVLESRGLSCHGFGVQRQGPSG
ncbi:MAG: hypothetical protein N2039_09845, partial [Gemmataceae bacterium]|nr:hypothetical protein [Gemmataceae bacterium]